MSKQQNPPQPLLVLFCSIKSNNISEEKKQCSKSKRAEKELQDFKLFVLTSFVGHHCLVIVCSCAICRDIKLCCLCFCDFVCVCAYKYVYIHIYTCIHNIYIYTYTYIYIKMHVYNVYICIYIDMY